jgi:hypothetical protein
VSNIHNMSSLSKESIKLSFFVLSMPVKKTKLI